MANWTIWQDSPEYGCNDNPSYEYFAQRAVDGHIVEFAGPFASYDDAAAATGLES